jgi:hypothetical protein
MEIKDVLERLTSKKASEEAIREIIEYHVTAALQAASEACENEVEKDFITTDLIINAYPLIKIK